MGIAGFFGKLRDGLSKTRESIVGTVQHILATRRTVDQETLDQIEEALLAADVGVQTTTDITEAMRRRVKDKGFSDASEVMEILKEEVRRILRSESVRSKRLLGEYPPRPYVILVVGVNGAGKTTTIGKLAHVFRAEGLNVLVGAGDTFRAAANEQLEIWANRAGVEIVSQDAGADPASVAFDTVSAGIARNADVVLLDTAGRLHTKVNLMEELRKIRRVVSKRLDGAPHEVLLVLDATTGQNGLQQARKFSEASGVTGLVLTKMDGTAKGGIILAVASEFHLPVRFVGVGEGIDDLLPFDPQEFADALLDHASSERA